MAEVSITPRANGPLMIQGNFKIVDAQGNEYSVEGDVVTLCRCGQSDNKPFCDGTHRDCGFDGPSEAK